MSSTNDNDNGNDNHTDTEGRYANLKGVFVGSGSDGMSDPRIATIIINLAKKSKKERRQKDNGENESVDNGTDDDNKIHVVYLGTATYDIEQFAKRQTKCFADQGCTVTYFNVVQRVPTKEEMINIFEKVADIIIVGGGNT